MPEETSTTKVDNNGAAPPDDQILNLDELVEPVGKFIIEGKQYFTREMGSLGLIEQKRIDNAWNRIQEIRTTKEPTEEMEKEYDALVLDIVPRITSIPAKVAKKIPTARLLQVVIVFFSYRTASQVALVMRMSQIQGKGGDQLIGEKLSPDLIASSLRQTQESG